MAVKTITVTEEAYMALASDKEKDESFSEVILRTHKRKGTVGALSKFIGAWSDMSDETAEKLHRHIEEVRKRAGKQRRKELMRHLTA